MRLSILIASLFERHSLLMRLLGSLAHQADRRLEVLTAIDQRHWSIGKKREHLLCRAHGDYICYLDDDDTVSDVFVKRILDALETEPDCVGYWGRIRHGSQSKKVRYSKANTIRTEADVFYRPIWIMNPVRRSIAEQVVFADVSTCEDRVYADQIQPLLKSEVFIDETLYVYHCRHAF